MKNFVVQCYEIDYQREQWVDSFDTLDEAIKALVGKMKEYGKNAKDFEGFPDSIRQNIATYVNIFDMNSNLKTEATSAQITAEFTKHPAIVLVGSVFFFESQKTNIMGHLRGLAEIEHYTKNDPGMKELARIMDRLGATATTVSGITVSGKKSKKRKK